MDGVVDQPILLQPVNRADRGIVNLCRGLHAQPVYPRALRRRRAKPSGIRPGNSRASVDASGTLNPFSKALPSLSWIRTLPRPCAEGTVRVNAPCCVKVF